MISGRVKKAGQGKRRSRVVLPHPQRPLGQLRLVGSPLCENGVWENGVRKRGQVSLPGCGYLREVVEG